MAITLAGIQWILISVSVSSNSLIIREGSTGELVIAKEVCILNIRLQLNLSKKKKNDGVLFLLLTLLVSTILDETLMAKAKQNGVSGWALMVRRRTSLNFESKCTLYQSKHYLNFSWSQSTQFVSPHKKFDVLSKALFFRRF